MNIHLTSLAVTVVSLSTATALWADAPTTAPASIENPVLARVGRAITFYLSFDHGTNADMARGKPAPIRDNDGVPTYRPGLYGAGMMLVGQGQSTLTYSTAGNIDLTKPGAMAVWTCPQDWVRSDEEDYFFPATFMCNGAKLMFGRQGQLKDQRTDCVYLWAKIGDSSQLLIGAAGGSKQWRNGQWHLWVMNWRANSVEFSLDGDPLTRKDTPIPFSDSGDNAGQLIVAAQTATCRYLVDELLVLNRPLGEDEIKQMYAEGMKQANAAATQPENRK